MHKWLAGRFAPNGAGARPPENPDFALMGRTGGALYAAGASLGLLWLALPHPSSTKDVFLLAVLGVAYVGAALMWFLGERMARAYYHAFVALGVVLISAAIVFSGAGSTPFVLFYLWSNLYVWYFFSSRAAAFHVGLMGVAYGVVLWLLAQPGEVSAASSSDWLPSVLGPSIAKWLITIGTLVITGLLLLLLRTRVEGLIAGLTRERNFISSVVETAPTLVMMFDLEGRIQVFNRACEVLTGLKAKDIQGREISSQVFVPDETEHRGREWYALLEYGGTRQFEVHMVARDGERRLIAFSAVLVRDENGAPDHVIATGIDITDRKRSEREIRARAVREAAVAELGRCGLQGLSLASLVDQALGLLAEHLALDLCEVWEPAQFTGDLELSAATGILADRAGNLSVRNEASMEPAFTLEADAPVIVTDYAAEDRFGLPEALARAGLASGISVTIPGPRLPLGVLSGHTRQARDFTDDDALFMESVAHVLGAAIERWRAEEAFRHNALHDSLTGLPNRALFLDRLGHVLTRRDPGHPHAAVMFLDIDNFKLINDSLGHDAGDRLLKAIGPRLDTALRPIDTVARFGGDEFVVLCEDVHDGRDAVIVAERLQRALAEPFPLDDGEDHFLSASIGVVLATGRYEDPDALLRDADAAMYRAKARGRAQSELFDDAMRNQVLGRLRMENALRGVLDRDELRVFYQPIVSLDDGSIQGFEALMRWHHDGLGPVSPLEFIPIAEETGLIVRLGAWVLEEACRQSVCWAEELGVPAPMVSVNLSPRQVAHAELVPTVARVLEETGLSPSRLALEITESVLIHEADSPWNPLDALKRLGVKLMLDDFGTGYSSLSYLKRFPVDALKIDRAFVDGLGADPGDSAIVKAVIGMAQALEIGVVAEGVETELQVAALRELGCTRAQGFLYGRPREAAATAELLRPMDPLAELEISPGPTPVS